MGETLKASRVRPVRAIAAASVIAVLASLLAVGVASGQIGDTGCWEEYRIRRVTHRGEARTRLGKNPLQVVTPRGVTPEDCTTPAADCLFGYHARTGRAHRVFVPFGMDPTQTCMTTAVDESPDTTVAPDTTDAPATTEAPETTEAPDTTEAPETTEAPDTTEAPPASGVPVATTPPEDDGEEIGNEGSNGQDGEETGTDGTDGDDGTDGSPITTVGFVERFDDNTGLDRFRTGVHHRDTWLVDQESWQGDHDLECGSPGTTRTIERSNPNDSFYLCREHLMTSVGDTSGYSIAYFSPKTTFINETSVSWDVNVTDLLNRQWWEVAILPLDAPDELAIHWLAGTADVAAYPDNAVVVGNGPAVRSLNLFSDGRIHEPMWQSICAIDSEACDSKAIRRTFTIVDNGDGTVTLDALDRTFTVAGSFPDGGFKVVFTDHNYTPNKDGVPIGYTWHWDNIIIQ